MCVCVCVCAPVKECASSLACAIETRAACFWAVFVLFAIVAEISFPTVLLCCLALFFIRCSPFFGEAGGVGREVSHPALTVVAVRYCLFLPVSFTLYSCPRAACALLPATVSALARRLSEQVSSQHIVEGTCSGRSSDLRWADRPAAVLSRWIAIGCIAAHD